jgi:6-phosphofructokinase 1
MNIGILTAGGDSPGLNAAIRGIGKAAIRSHGMSVIGFRDGFRGLMQNRHLRLDSDAMSGILIAGGTILGTSRDKPSRMNVGGVEMDMTGIMIETYEAHHLDAVVCLGGGGTQKNALHLAEAGMKVVTLPKTIDNDVAGTDITFGFATAMDIATEAIDRLHSTAHSHHRIIVVEVMGHNAGWLALGSGLAGGADVILIPELPFHIDAVAESILARQAAGSPFSIVTVSEGAMSVEHAEERTRLKEVKRTSESQEDRAAAELRLTELKAERADATHLLSRQLEERTRLESRVTILGHVQRGGIPSPLDRLLATRLGTATADFIADGRHGIMVASRGEEALPVPLEEVAGQRRAVPLDHPWIKTARTLGVSLGD